MKYIDDLCPRIDESEMRPASEKEVEKQNKQKYKQKKLKVHQMKELY